MERLTLLSDKQYKIIVHSIAMTECARIGKMLDALGCLKDIQ